VKRSLVVVAFLSMCSLVLASPAHATCGAESCPLVNDALHAGGRIAFDVRVQEATQDRLWNGTASTTVADVVSGAESHGEIELYTHTRTVLAEARLRVTDRLSLTATLPWMDREHRHALAHTSTFDPATVDTWRYRGFADATVLGSYHLLGSHHGLSVMLQAGAKLPTGLAHVDGEVRDNAGFESALEPSARPGTGSLDAIAGVTLSHPLPVPGMRPLAVSLQQRWTGKGTDDYEVGDETMAGAATAFGLGERLTLLAQVNYARHAADVSAEASEASHSAIQSLYVTPGARVRLAAGVSAYGMLQWRAWTKSEEATVVAPRHLMVGLRWSAAD